MEKDWGMVGLSVPSSTKTELPPKLVNGYDILKRSFRYILTFYSI